MPSWRHANLSIRTRLTASPTSVIGIAMCRLGLVHSASGCATKSVIHVASFVHLPGHMAAAPGREATRLGRAKEAATYIQEVLHEVPYTSRPSTSTTRASIGTLCTLCSARRNVHAAPPRQACHGAAHSIATSSLPCGTVRWICRQCDLHWVQPD